MNAPTIIFLFIVSLAFFGWLLFLLDGSFHPPQPEKITTSAAVIPMGSFGGYMAGPTVTFTLPPTPMRPAEEQLATLAAETKFGELTGWRTWNIIPTPEGYRLISMGVQAIWPSSSVGPKDGLRNSHLVKTDPWAGWYSFKDKHVMFQRMLVRGYAIYGEVEMWGDILEFRDGYHAEYCKIKSLQPNMVVLEHIEKDDPEYTKRLMADLHNHYLET